MASKEEKPKAEVQCDLERTAHKSMLFKYLCEACNFPVASKVSLEIGRCRKGVKRKYIGLSEPWFTHASRNFQTNYE